MKLETRYITTDIFLSAAHDLTRLAEALDHRGLITYHVVQHDKGLWFARLRAGESYLEPDENIAAMLTAVEALEEPFWSMWVACKVRDFEIGYDCGQEPREFNQHLSTVTLARIAAVSASVMITLYPAILDGDGGSCAVAPERNESE
jgi:hypothetical protein